MTFFQKYLVALSVEAHSGLELVWWELTTQGDSGYLFLAGVCFYK